MSAPDVSRVRRCAHAAGTVLLCSASFVALGCATSPREALSHAWAVPRDGVLNAGQRLASVVRRPAEEAEAPARSSANQAATVAGADHLADDTTTPDQGKIRIASMTSEDEPSTLDKMLAPFANIYSRNEELPLDPFAQYEQELAAEAGDEESTADTQVATGATEDADPVAATSRFASDFDSQLERLRAVMAASDTRPQNQHSPAEDTHEEVTELMRRAELLAELGKPEAAYDIAVQARERAAETNPFFGPDEKKPGELVRAIEAQLDALHGDAGPITSANDPVSDEETLHEPVITRETVFTVPSTAFGHTEPAPAPRSSIFWEAAPGKPEPTRQESHGPLTPKAGVDLFEQQWRAKETESANNQPSDEAVSRRRQQLHKSVFDGAIVPSHRPGRRTGTDSETQQALEVSSPGIDAESQTAAPTVILGWQSIDVEEEEQENVELTSAVAEVELIESTAVETPPQVELPASGPVLAPPPPPEVPVPEEPQQPGIVLAPVEWQMNVEPQSASAAAGDGQFATVGGGLVALVLVVLAIGRSRSRAGRRA